MSGWIVAPIAGLIEPAIAPEFFIHTVGAIEMIGPDIRVYYCTEQMPLEAGNAIPQHIVTCKIVRPITTIPAAIARLAQCLVHQAGGPEHPKGPWVPHVVS